MRVILELKGYLSWYTPNQVSELALDVPPGTTIRQAFALADLPFPEVAIAVVDGRQVDFDMPLDDGQTVSLIPPIAGG